MNPAESQTTSTMSGSKATDFQPTTQNPQGNVGGGLQPVTTSNGNNVFNQPGINAQAFPKTNSLRVKSTGNVAPTSANNTAPPQMVSTGSVLLFLLVAAASVAVLIFLALLARPKPKAEEFRSEMNHADTLLTKTNAKQKKKARSKKKSTKKK